MKTDYTRKLTPEQEAALAEMKAAIAAYNGPITKIPEKSGRKSRSQRKASKLIGRQV